MFEAILIYHPHNEGVRMQLLDQFGQVLADSDKGKIQMANLQTDNYTFRVVGAISKPVDFTIRSKQHNINKSND
ncbi:MAG TPA: hypothetical protein VMM84_13780 [Pyrinomonadaceae bacterium]|nr:hypothetical protein [Pyrinomonadaceae bacterium]